jgi:plastocyanin
LRPAFRFPGASHEDLNLIVLAAVFACGSALASQEHVVAQKDKSFSTKKLDIKVGDKVAFRNDDGFSHNIFSLTDAMPFDLGTYGSGPAEDGDLQQGRQVRNRVRDPSGHAHGGQRRAVIACSSRVAHAPCSR